MSLAGFTPLASLEDALSAVAQSSILIGTSGNDATDGGADIHYPESHPDVITVGGTDRFDALAYFSDTGDTVEFSAPAVDIATASWAAPNDPQAVTIGNGTSFAAPCVSGIAILGLEIRSFMTKADFVYALRESAVDLGTPGRDRNFGWGRVNANQAIIALENLVFIDGFETGDLTAWSESSP